MDAVLNSGVFTWVVLPLLICVSRICDVTIGTVRIVSVSRGKKFLASALGFFEALVYIIAITQVMRNVHNVAAYLAYGTGFALGNYIGITIGERVALGEIVIRLITPKDVTALLDSLHGAGYGYTVVGARGATGPVSIIYTVIKRGALAQVHDLIFQFDPQAFYSVEDARSVNAGVFPAHPSARRGAFWGR